MTIIKLKLKLKEFNSELHDYDLILSGESIPDCINAIENGVEYFSIGDYLQYNSEPKNIRYNSLKDMNDRMNIILEHAYLCRDGIDVEIDQQVFDDITKLLTMKKGQLELYKNVLEMLTTIHEYGFGKEETK